MSQVGQLAERAERFADRHPARAEALAGLFAAAAALIFLALLPASVQGNDSADYTEFYQPVAYSLLRGEGLTSEGEVAARYPPGFPAALAAAIGAGQLFGLGEAPAVGLLGLLGFAATAAALFRLGRACHGAGAGFLAAGAFALYPPHLFLVKQPNSELVFLPLLIFGLELAWRSRRGDPRLALAAGALLGAGALVRPIALGLFLPLGIFLFLFADSGADRRRRFLLAAALAAGQLLVMAPWVLHLREHTGRWVPLSTGGRLSMLDGLTIGVKKDRPGPPLPERVTTLMREVDAARPELRSPGSIFEFLRERARREPVTIAQLLAIKTARSFYGTDSLRYEGWLLAIQLPLLLLSAAALWRAGRRPEREPWRPLAFLAALVLLYFLAMTVLVLSILRYLVPAMALLFLLLGATAAETLAAGRLRAGRPASSAGPS